MQANERLARSALLLVLIAIPALVHSPAEDPHVPAPHQNPLCVDLSGSRKLIFEDRPEFADPAYDDSAWQSISLPGELPGVRSGLQLHGWLRRRAEVPLGTDCRNLALTIGVITQSRYEVWLNGSRLPSSEKPDPSDVRIPRPITYRIPPCTAPLPSSLLIALHFVTIDMHPDWRLPDCGPYLLTYQINAPVDVGGRAIAIQRDRISPPLVFAIAIFLILAIFCVVVWSTDRGRIELLWFAMVALERIIYSCFELAGFNPSASTLPARLNFIDEFFVLPILGEVIFASLVIRRTHWLRILNWLSASPMVFFTLGWVSFTSAVVSCIGSGTLLTGIIVFNWWQQRRRQLTVEEHLLRFILLLPGLQIAVYWTAYLNGIVLYAYGSVGSIKLPLFRFDFSWFVVALAVFVLLMRRTLADRRTQQRLAQELEAARQVQRLLVSGNPIVAGDLDITSAYVPAQEVGGDFYYLLDGDIVVLGDVSGKGLKAAMLVSLIIGVLRNCAERRPAAILAAMNRAIAGQTDGGFITCICARFESDGSVVFANAGHLPPYLDGAELPLEPCFPLGIMPAAEFSETTVPFTLGSVVTLVSDGVVEATNPHRELFGFARTREISTLSAEKIVESSRAWGQNDDITVVTIRKKL